MIRTLFLACPAFAVLFAVFLSSAALGSESNPGTNQGLLSLWYDKPAAFVARPSEDGGRYKTLIDQALVIGNGRFGAMIQGGVEKELLRLSENTMWTGGPNPSGYYSQNMGRFQALGDLAIDLTGQGTSTRYLRSLDIGNAVSQVSYTAGGITYRREYFASHPDQVLVVRLTASQPGSYSGSLNFTDAHQRVSIFEKNLITVVGGFDNGLHYETQILVLNEGGSQKVGGGQYEQKIEFDHCDSLTILVAVGTNYVMDPRRYFLSHEDPHDGVSRQIQAAAAQTFEKLKAAHVADYQSLFNRYSIDLGASSEAQRSLTTDLRCKQAAKETDLEFERLFCQYGRYLIISCSRQGGVAANGQGLWNDCNNCQFGARYTDDIAPTEMDYWSVEPTNLAECHLPLLDLIQSQIPAWRHDTQISSELKLADGTLTKRGWMIRGDHNIMGGMSMRWNMGANAWYLNHFWEHYAFSRDKDYLKKVAYPLLKETCEYWEDHLKALPDGRLVVPGFWSPEHGPWEVDGVSYSQELVWDLFTNYVEACDVLGVDRAYRDKVAGMMGKLLKPGVGSWGQLLEWMTEMKDTPPATDREKKEEASEGHLDTPQNSHRHTSHLLSVYPLRQISYEQTPELAAAAKVSLISRGNTGGVCCFSFVNRAAIFARLYDGDKAYDQIRYYFNRATPNLLSDCVFDATPALPGVVAEMLLQSHQNDLHILPALPKAWPAGSVKGLRARGGYEVDEQWKEGKLTSLTIRSIAGEAVNVRYGSKTIKVELHPGESVTLNGNLQANR